MTEVTPKSLSDALYAVGTAGEFGFPDRPQAYRLDAYAAALIKELEVQNQKKRTALDELLFRGDETITLNELTAALIALGASDDTAKRAARRHVRHALDHREPDWKIGDVVRDNAGRVFVRRSDGNWTRNGSELIWSHDQPIRPLKHLKEV